MPDKKCPHCGLWNSPVALKCDCGFDFATGEFLPVHTQNMPAMTSIIKGSLFGLLGVVLAALPVSIFKTWAYLMGVCQPFPSASQADPVFLTYCGPVYFLFLSDPADRRVFPIYAFIILIAGSLLGALVAALFRRRARAKPGLPFPGGPRISYWSAFLAGVVFDILFVFIFLYVGQ